VEIAKRILITGLPGSGKTTLIKKLATRINTPFRGFFTSEIIKGGSRVGFEVESFAGKRALMSHIDIKSPYRVGKYGVDIVSFEKIALPEIKDALRDQSILIIDEIGKMELFSTRFKDLLTEIFTTEISLIATIMYTPNSFCDKLKGMPGTNLFTISKNQSDIFNEIARNL
jgi:nucleoside-triphosphatase